MSATSTLVLRCEYAAKAKALCLLSITVCLPDVSDTEGSATTQYVSAVICVSQYVSANVCQPERSDYWEAECTGHCYVCFLSFRRRCGTVMDAQTRILSSQRMEVCVGLAQTGAWMLLHLAQVSAV